MKTTLSLRLLPYLGLTLLLEDAAAQDVSSSSIISYQTSSIAVSSPGDGSSYVSPSSADAAAATSSTLPPPPPPPPASTTSQIPDVVTSVAYVTVTTYVVDPGAATPSSSVTSADLTVTVDSYLPESASTLVTQYVNGTSTSTTTIWWTPSSSSSTVWWTPSPSSTWTSIVSSWDSQGHSQYTSHDHGPPSPTSTTTVFALPQSTDASAYLHHVFPPSAAQPTWATGSFYTQLASALYAVDRSFAGRTDYATIVAAISQAGDDSGSPQVSESIAQSAWGWAAVTSNSWYQSDVPAPVKTDVAQYIDAWHNAEYSVLDEAQKAEATPTGKSAGGGGSGSSGGKGGGGGDAAASEAAPGKDGLRVMVVVVTSLLVGVIGLL